MYWLQFLITFLAVDKKVWPEVSCTRNDPSSLQQGTDTDCAVCSWPWQWFALGKPTIPRLSPVTDVCQLKTHWAEVQSCFVRARCNIIFGTALSAQSGAYIWLQACYKQKQNYVTEWQTQFMFPHSSPDCCDELLRHSPTLCRSNAFSLARGCNFL